MHKSKAESYERTCVYYLKFWACVDKFTTWASSAMAENQAPVEPASDTCKSKKKRWIPLEEKDSEILKGYQFKFRVYTKNNRRRKIIVCKYDNCKKEFNKTWSFLYHARMHEGERPFECPVCSRKFSQKSNMKKHMKHHVLTTVNQRKLFRCHLW